MPEAEPFSFRGRGNGLPFCVTKVNVLDYAGTGQPVDHWTTFSGWSKDSEPTDTAASISESLQLASRWYYNLSHIEGSCSHNGNSLGVDPVALTDGVFAGSNVYDNQTDDERPLQPSLRSCGVTIYRKYGLPEEWGETTEGVINTSLTALYKGVTTDEDNFIGYSAGNVGNLGGGSATGFYAQSFAKAGVSIGGFLPAELPVANVFKEEYAYVEYDSMSFVASAYALDGQGGDIVATLDASVPSASCVYDRLGEIWTADAEITGVLTFFTYP